MLPEATGVDTYLLQLAAALGEIDPGGGHTLFVNREDRQRVAALVPSSYRIRAWSLRPRAVRLAFQQVVLPAATVALDVVHSPSFIMPLVRGSARHLLTVYDMTFFSRPEHHEPLRRSAAYLWAVRTSIRRADLVTVPSRATLDAVRRWVPGVSADRLRLVPAGIDAGFGPASAEAMAATLGRLGLTTPFLLFVGTLEPRKNLVRLVESFVRLRTETGYGGRLVLAGRPGWGLEELDAAVAASGCCDRIVRLGYVPDADMAPLMTAADLLAYPSLEEGFGFPPLEAMACGTPVVSSTTSSLAENLAGAAELVDPTDIGALTGALRRVLGDPDLRARLAAAGRLRAAAFRWDRTARATVDCYRELAGLPAAAADLATPPAVLRRRAS